ncbi:hypothetical protein [Pseudomonas sp. 2FE]|uniref:hypothetical protein n=1 Tax=Pseudomonas sp. 2FE TaxID=2502190 RepID=UPI0010F43918|nr:hypothetical protein [Pseudomonas sp. 2FE]
MLGSCSAPCGRNEVLLLPTQQNDISLFFCARTDKGQWQVAGRFEQAYSTEELIEAARMGRVQKVMPRYQSLQVGQQLFVPLPPED